MVMLTQKLWSVLEILAVIGLVANGVENVQGAVAHKPAPRGPHEIHHRHLAAQVKIREEVIHKQEKKGLIRRKADGTVCRVKGSVFSPSTSAASSAAPPPTSAASSAAATSASSAAYVASASSAAANNNNNNNNNNYVQAAETSTTSSAAAVATQQAAAVSIGGNGLFGGWKNSASKMGAAWPNGNWAQPGDSNYVGNYIGSKTSWYYTWSPFSVGSADSLGLEFVPMLWGTKQIGDWHAQQANWPSTVKNALFFNEPNQADQAEISASDSVSTWMNHFLPVRSKGIQLGGAATTSAPSGLQWILDFSKLCVQYGNSAADCHMDFVPLHWYDTTPQNFQAYVQNFHDKTGADIWITEYACQNFNGGAQCSDSETWYLHQTMAAWFDQQDYVKRYAPFGVMKDMQGVNQDNALMNPDGSITALGNWYIWSS